VIHSGDDRPKAGTITLLYHRHHGALRRAHSHQSSATRNECRVAVSARLDFPLLTERRQHVRVSRRRCVTIGIIALPYRVRCGLAFSGKPRLAWHLDPAAAVPRTTQCPDSEGRIVVRHSPRKRYGLLNRHSSAVDLKFLSL
jgi:hypothetical protein